MSEPTNDPVILTGHELINLIRPVVLDYTKHEGYTDQIMELVDTGTRMRISYDNLSPAGVLAYSAISLLDSVDPPIVDICSGILIDRIRNMEPPADLPLRDAWLEARDNVVASFVEAQALGAMAQLEVHSIMTDDLAVDWSQLNGLDVTEGGTNG